VREAWRRRRAGARGDGSERGAAATEFALVAPFLILLVFGLITTGMTYSDHLAATNAVREGARYGAASDITSGSWATSVRSRVTQVYFNAGTTVTDDQICVRLVTASGSTYAEAIGANCGTAPSAPSDMASGSCAVLVWMKRPEAIRLVIFPDITFDIGAQSVAYYSRTTTDGPPPTCTAT
jgi:Flp pilus assembly protein TadG